MASRPDDPGPGLAANQVQDGTELDDGIVDEGIVDEGMRTRRLPGDGGLAADAGEYVLGTLDTNELEAFSRAAETDPEAKRLVTFWRDRLGALDAVAAPVAPSAGVWSAIEAALPAGTMVSANDNAIEELSRSRNFWRGAAVAATIVLAGGALAFANPALRGQAERRLGLPSFDRPVVPDPSANGGSYLAVVNAEGKLPAMIVRVDAETGQVSVRPLALPRPEGRSLELWYIAKGQADAVSVGLLDEGSRIKNVAAKPGDTFAVTEEAPGGSSTGKATGPIVLSGQLLREPD